MNRNLTILIIEDSGGEAQLLKLALRRAGINNPIHLVPTGEEAIAYLSGSGPYADRSQYPFPSVLFMDLKMPRVDGFAVLKWLRSHPDFAIIPVIVLTNSALDADVRQAYQLGANSYMVKPTNLDELTQMLRTAYEYWAWCKKPALPETR